MKELLSHRIDIKTDINSNSLMCARHLLLRAFLYNPCVSSSMIENVIVGYLQLTPELDPSGLFWPFYNLMFIRINSRRNRRITKAIEKAIGWCKFHWLQWVSQLDFKDISKRLQVQSACNSLFQINQNIMQSLFNKSKF